MSEQCAYHEAGHAMMAHHHGARVRFLTIEPDWEDDALRHDGEVEIEWNHQKYSRKSLAEASIQVALAGPAAEMIHTGNAFHPGFIQEWSMDWKVAWELSAGLFKTELEQLRYLEKVTMEIHQYFSTDRVWQAIASLVDEILAHEHLEEEEIHEALNNWI